MRNGPELRITGAVTTVTADTSVVITQAAGDSQEVNQQAADLVVTMTQALTAGWRVGERVEITVRSLGG